MPSGHLFFPKLHSLHTADSAGNAVRRGAAAKQISTALRTFTEMGTMIPRQLDNMNNMNNMSKVAALTHYLSTQIFCTVVIFCSKFCYSSATAVPRVP